ncbi:MAG TPA: glycosyl hydrolase family 8, partial [Candidatus Goldiibacteriota bacterium]|nr:glycosyl hydrolase family 8 [Candidatus Goldiibacteriota bacterium]
MDIKRLITAVLTVLFVSAGMAYAAPVYVNYGYGNQLTNGTAYATDLNTKWTNYKGKFVVANATRGGSRVMAPEYPHNGRTVSEGQAYGMIFAVYMDDRTTFDALLKYKLAICALDGNSQLMPWSTSTDGNTITDGGSATDADTDMAWALMKAAERWGGSPSGITGALTYTQYAQGMLNAIAN